VFRSRDTRNGVFRSRDTRNSVFIGDVTGETEGCDRRNTYKTDMAHVRQSKPDYGLGSQAKIITTF